MGIPIRIDEALYETAKVRAKAEMRSIPQQVAYWAKVGRAALDNPDLPIEFVRDTLLALEEESEPFEPALSTGLSVRRDFAHLSCHWPP